MVIRDLLLAVAGACGMAAVITGVGTSCVIIACGLCLVSRFFQSVTLWCFGSVILLVVVVLLMLLSFDQVILVLV